MGSYVLVGTKVSQGSRLLLDQLMERNTMGHHEIFFDIYEIVHRDVPAAGNDDVDGHLLSLALTLAKMETPS